MNRKQAISLIVLIITIVVMVILTGIIVIRVRNTRIIGEAEDAVEKSNLATIKQLAQLGWAEAYADGARTEGELQAGIDEIFEKNKIDTSKYAIIATTSGTKVVDVETVDLATIKDLAEFGWAEAYAAGAKTKKEFQAKIDAIFEKSNIDISEYGIVATTNGTNVVKGWIQDGLTIKKGTKILNVGDNIAYDETSSGTKYVSQNVDWKILGASDEGEVLIMSATDVVSNFGLASNSLNECQNDWLTGVEQLDKKCEPYGNGKSAIGARSIRVEDIDKVTGFDKTTNAKGRLREYGNEVTFSFNGTTKPAYTATNGLSGTYRVRDNDFYYYNGTSFVIADLTTEKGIITTIKSDGYSYSGTSLLSEIDIDKKACGMLFGNNGDSAYWLASPYAYVGDAGVSTFSGVVFGLQFVMRGNVNCESIGWSESGAVHFQDMGFWSINGDYASTVYKFGVRAVVTLSKDIQVEGSSTTGWTY